MRATFIAVFLLAVLLGTVSAATFTTELVTLDEVIFPGGTATFELAVTNLGEGPDTYSVSSNEFGFVLLIDPRPGEIAPGETGVFGLELSPRNFVAPGTHRVPVKIRSQISGDTITREPIIFVRDPNASDNAFIYTPSIALAVSATSSIDPREDLVLNVALRNRNARNYNPQDPITVLIESDIFTEQYNTNLGPVGQLGEKTNEVRIDLDPYQEPGEHPLVVKVIVQNRTVSERTQKFVITSYANTEIVPSTDKGLFTKSTQYKLRNDGNVPKTATIEYGINPLNRLFTTSSHNYELTDTEDGLVLVVSRELQPLEEDTVTITENYRLLVLLILLVIASFIGYYVLRSPVVLGKEAVIAGTPDDGVSEIKVRVHVKNRSSKTMRHLRVIDRISGMADVLKEESLGTLKPTKVVKKEGQGTLLRWDLDQLEPFEERLISYTARTPLKLVGDVALPAVKVKFDVPSGRERTAHSNEVSISRAE